MCAHGCVCVCVRLRKQRVIDKNETGKLFIIVEAVLWVPGDLVLADFYNKNTSSKAKRSLSLFFSSRKGVIWHLRVFMLYKYCFGDGLMNE